MAKRKQQTPAIALDATEGYGPLGVRFVINGNRYPLRSLGSATLPELIAIKRQTGLGVNQLRDLFGRMNVTVDELLEDEQLMTAWCVQIWLARHDKRLSIMDAVSDFALNDIGVELQPTAEDDGAEDSEGPPK